MKPSRRLTLKSQLLPDLTTDEMSGVAGGTHIGCGVTHGNTCEVCNVPTLPINECFIIITQTCNILCRLDTVFCAVG